MVPGVPLVAHNKLLIVSNDRKTVQVALGGDMQGTEPELCWVDAHKRFEQRYPMQERSSLIDGAVLCAHCESMLRLGVGSCLGYTARGGKQPHIPPRWISFGAVWPPDPLVSTSAPTPPPGAAEVQI